MLTKIKVITLIPNQNQNTIHMEWQLSLNAKNFFWTEIYGKSMSYLAPT